MWAMYTEKHSTVLEKMVFPIVLLQYKFAQGKDPAGPAGLMVPGLMKKAIDTGNLYNSKSRR